MTQLRQQIWDLYIAGNKPTKIAADMGKSVGAIRNAIYLAREELGKEAEPEQDRPRCSCGLSLPCNDCTKDPEWRQRLFTRNYGHPNSGIDTEVSSNSDLRQFPLTSTVLPELKLGNRELNGPSVQPMPINKVWLPVGH